MTVVGCAGAAMFNPLTKLQDLALPEGIELPELVPLGTLRELIILVGGLAAGAALRWAFTRRYAPGLSSAEAFVEEGKGIARAGIDYISK